MLVAAIIFIITLIFVIWQPRGLGIGWSACTGAFFALLFGVIHFSDIFIVWDIIWNATFTFIAIIIISLILDESGFFEWAASHILKLGFGLGRILFTWIILLGAGISAIFTNDGAALILTPIVIAMTQALQFNLKTTLALLMSAGFIADSASLPLIVSNLVNIVTADFFDISFTEYARIMIPVNFVSIGASLIILHLFFYNDIPNLYQEPNSNRPKDAIKDIVTFYAGFIILTILLIAFFILEPLGIPVSFIAAIAALALMVVAVTQRKINTLKVIKQAPWQIVIFSLGMYLVVYGLRNAGLTDFLSLQLSLLAKEGILVATIGTGLLSALLSSIMNNLPTVLIGAISIDNSDSNGLIKDAMIYAHIIGSDLGPKMTPIGSLATLLWLHVLAKKNIYISWGYYFKIGITLTLPVLLITLFALVWIIR
ncbi:arsenic transporter [Thorsellia anophelis]|uniref:Arsenical pump membrane protein n=1 Tax=Thorsellia anophelis DSM 18579 TaxID=1123402 RepID=A0A1I0CIE1_9GAMM|nr:arsenic transporter [Thorsellia anophelis]SET19192.1 arsenite efflux membrane protein ArsB [Thorsellia anophelis DSM 18579]